MMLFGQSNIALSRVLLLLVLHVSTYQINANPLSSSESSLESLSRLRGNSRRANTFVITQSSSSQVTTLSNASATTTNTTTLPPYYITNDLGTLNYDITLGNPLKGLAKNPLSDGSINTGVSFTLEAFYIRFDSVVRGPNGLYNWTIFENYLNNSASRNIHVIPRFYITYPGEVLGLPPFLIDTVPMRQYYDQSILQYTPYFGDAALLKEIQNFIYAFGKKYDGDKRIAFIQAGLLGFWGEWHCSAVIDCIPESSKDLLVQWYDQAFNITKIQVRSPRPSSKIAKMGYHEDSFTFATLDGPANGNVYRKMFFWNRIIANNETHFWKHAPMGGEVRPENFDIVFESSYPAGTEYKQDFMLCANTTHTTYMKHGFVFRDTMMSSTEILNANKANVRMGYSYYVDEVAVSNSTKQSNTVDIKVAIKQVGIAPFYYPLSVSISCKSLLIPISVSGVERLIERNQFEYYTFHGVPATLDCLSLLSVSLTSPWLYPDKPIRFAQGTTGTVQFSLPLPSAPTKTLFLRTYSPTAVPIDAILLAEQQFYVNLVLVDAITDLDIGPMYSDDPNSVEFQTEPIDLSKVGKSLSIRAMINNATKLSFKWYENNKPTLWTESTQPYAMKGNIGTDYLPVSYLSTPGLKSIRVVAQDITGAIFAERTISFTFIQSNATTNVTSPVVLPIPSPSTVLRPTTPTTPAVVPIRPPTVPTVTATVPIRPPTVPTVLVTVPATPAAVPIRPPTVPTASVTVPVTPTAAVVIVPPRPVGPIPTSPTVPVRSPIFPTPTVTIPSTVIVSVPVSVPISISTPISVIPRPPATPTTTVVTPTAPQIISPILGRTNGRTYTPTNTPTTAPTKLKTEHIEFFLVHTEIDWDHGEIKPDTIYSSSNRKVGTSLTVYADILTMYDISYTTLEYKNDKNVFKDVWVMNEEHDAPFALAGMKGTNFIPSPYLSYPGIKNIRATAYDFDDNVIVSSGITFEIQ